MRGPHARLNRAKTALLVLLTVPFLYPFAFLLGTAFKPLPDFNRDEVGFPSRLTWANLTTAWNEANLGPANWHSCIAVGVGVAVTVIISAAGAFWFMRHTGRIATLLRVAIIGTLALPAPVFVIPLFVLLSDQGLTDNLVVLGFVYAGTTAGFGLYLMHAYFKSIPAEILEAAQVDGASLLAQFWRVILPLSKPAIATLAALTFVWSWGDLLLAVVLVQDPGQRTLTVSAALLADQYSTDIPKEAAGVVVAIIPMLVVFLIGQRYLVRGIAAGVGK